MPPVARLCAVLVIALLIAPAGASAGWPAPPFGNVVAQDLETAWLLPANGAVVAFAGGLSIDYSRRLGLLAIARRRRLVVVDASGRLRWARGISALPGAPRWSSARPVRLAVLAGHALQLVDGEGRTALRLGRARDVAPAWRPRVDQIAFVRPDGEVVVASGGGRVLARWRPGRMPVGLSWTGNGRHLVVSLRFSVVVLDPSLRPEWSMHSPAILSAAAAPVGTRFALLTVSATATGAPVTTLELRDAARPPLHARLARAWTLGGRIVWSPDGRDVIVARPVLRDWLLITVRTHRARRLVPPRDLPADHGFALPIAWK
jgi:hypothetical protein